MVQEAQDYNGQPGQNTEIDEMQKNQWLWQYGDD